MQVTHEGNIILGVEGNACKRGEAYAKTELVDPRRMVATTVQVEGGIHPLAPVYTAAPISKLLIFDLLAELRQVKLRAPVRAGQVVLGDALGSGVTVLASRDLPPTTG